MQLQTAPMLREELPEGEQAQRPVYLSGDALEGQQDSHVRIDGDAELRRGDTVIRADHMEYRPAEREARAEGNVHINKAGDVYQGRELQINVDSYQGHFDDVRYRFHANQAHGEASRIDFLSRDEYLVHAADYTTCQRAEHDPDWQPAWQIRARELHLDRLEDVGLAKGAVLEFMGVPLLAAPYLSFPLSDRRKSGFLPPTVGIDSVSGFEYEQPYYWNIAPNMDATLTTGLMLRRGVNFAGELRYLQPDFSGELAGRWMPDDSLRDDARWSLAARHRQAIDSTALGPMKLEANLNRVSDSNYWRDFSYDFGALTPRLLPSDLLLTGGQGDWRWQMRSLKWQTLQDTDSVIVPPYDVLPQMKLRYQPGLLAGGVDVDLEFDATRFQADRRFRSSLNDGDRFYMLARASRPFAGPQGFLTPSLQLHASHYRFERSALSGGERSHSRVVPTYSLDSGLVFEREAQYRGRGLLQTLEPRLLYTYTPYRDQSMLPMYDTAEMDFNFASIFSPNSYVGQDRIADNNLLTLGLTSRLLAQDSGTELARASIAQRYRFSNQRVTSPGVSPVQERWSDILLGGAVNWTSRWGTEGVLQYNFKERESIRYTLTGFYRPGEFRVLSAGYRMKRDSSKQAELGWQWPLADFGRLWGADDGAASPGAQRRDGRWYTVGRLNYSMRDKKLVDTTVGLEYDGCCWVGRVVLERLQNSFNSSSTRVMFQLELVGLSRINIGSNPLSSLRDNVPHYQVLREESAQPSSRFSQYD
ncbi:LPS-assembly protein LptD [Corticibacter populi]|nr:LPS-assembly protein LptD [Corticibacter populi]